MTNVHELRPGHAGQEPGPDVLISEDQVLRWRPMLAKSLLLGARKLKKITHTIGSRGSIWYRLRDVDAFLKTREQQCQGLAPDPSSNSADIGSQKSPAAPGSIASGMMPELAEHAAEASAHRILGTHKSA
jgi:hypothetical protein